MKIGILTLPLHTNYGGILQAYALQTILERMGHEVKVIEQQQKKRPLWKMPIIYSKRVIRNLRGCKCPIFYEQKMKKELPILRQFTNKFIKEYIHIITYKSLNSINQNEYDAYIVGSDQIWRPKYYPNIKNAFLSFTNGWNVKRIAYAASFGTDKWEYTAKQTQDCSKLAHHFDGISVREKSGIQLCQQHLQIEAQHVLDPTMLLEKEDYVRLIQSPNITKNTGNLLVYILDETPDKILLINKIANEKKLKPLYVNSKIENINAKLEERIQPPVEQWLSGFLNASFVITDSFHACVFSILFKKPFIVYGNKERGIARFTSLLNMFNLQNRFITSSTEYTAVEDFDYDNVYEKLNEMRNSSKSFIESILNNNQ